MPQNRYNILAIVIGFLLVFSLIRVQTHKSLFFQGGPPDIEGIINMYPKGWEAVGGTKNDPKWDASYQMFYDNAVFKFYRNAAGETVMVVITWSHDGIHRPGHFQQICYQAAGSTVSPPVHSSLLTGVGRQNITEFTAHNEKIVEDVLYWRITGGKPDIGTDSSTLVLTGSSLWDRLAERFGKLIPLAKSLIYGIPDNVMVRVSAARKMPDEPATVHIEYAKAFLESLPEKERKIVMGGSGEWGVGNR